MIVYRVQASTKEGWIVEWCDSQREARDSAALMSDLFERVHIDRIELDTDRQGIVEALNFAHVHRMNWPGEAVG